MSVSRDSVDFQFCEILNKTKYLDVILMSKIYRWTSTSTIGYPGSTHSSYICTNYAASPEPRSRTAK